MSEYLSTVNPGDTRLRIFRLFGSNDLNRSPSMQFFEERIIRDASDVERSLGRTRDVGLSYDPEKVLVTRNPETDAAEAVGRIPAELTMAEAYVVLYTLGRTAQLEQDDRDAERLAQEEG